MSKPTYDTQQLKSLEEGWFFYDHAWTLLFEIARKIEGDSVLDVGCGTGLALSVLKGLFPWRVVRGADPSADAAPYWQARGIAVDVASATALPYDDRAFDTVYSSHAVEHIVDDKMAVSEIVRVAAKRAIIVVPDGDVQAKNFGSPHVHVYNRKSFAALASSCVSSSVKVAVYSLPHTHISNLIAVFDRSTD